MVEPWIYWELVEDTDFDPLAPVSHWVLPEDVKAEPKKQE